MSYYNEPASCNVIVLTCPVIAVLKIILPLAIVMYMYSDGLHSMQEISVELLPKYLCLGYFWGLISEIGQGIHGLADLTL